jgi:hypothetical protein
MPARSKTGGLTANQTLNLAPVIFSYEVSADATGAPVAFVAPCDIYITDIIVEARATSGAATMSILNAGTAGSGTDAMCTAIACATDGAVTRMSAGADDTKLLLPKGTVVKVDASANDVRGRVTFVGIRV